jgi:hypothetical protein
MPERAGQDNIVVQVLAALGRLRVLYMVVGSMAVNYYGLPRSSHDLDLVVQVSAAHVPGLLAEFQREFYGSWAAKLHLEDEWDRLQQLPEEKVP